MANTMLQDSAGNTSSKRVMGTIGMGIFILASVGIAFYSVSTGNTVDPGAVTLINGVGYVSGGLLGVGVIEGLRKPSN